MLLLNLYFWCFFKWTISGPNMVKIICWSRPNFEFPRRCPQKRKKWGLFFYFPFWWSVDTRSVWMVVVVVAIYKVDSMSCSTTGLHSRLAQSPGGKRIHTHRKVKASSVRRQSVYHYYQCCSFASLPARTTHISSPPQHSQYPRISLILLSFLACPPDNLWSNCFHTINVFKNIPH